MKKEYKSPYLPQRKADGVSIPLPKPDYDFEGAVSGFDYEDPKVYPSQVDPDLEGGMGSSAEGIYDNQYSLAGSILDVLLEDQGDTLNPSAVMNADKLEQELEQRLSEPAYLTTDGFDDVIVPSTSKKSMTWLDSPLVTGGFLFILGFFLAQSLVK
tara:strand:- start:1166 stop:1633 length:468 start_codon:yes stop_codon:yes gene_type:complete